MISLPATAHKVIGSHLPAADALSCALASRHLADVVAAERPGSLVVVASSFQQQLRQESQASWALCAALQRKAASSRAACVYVDVAIEFDPSTWRQLFTALASSRALRQLTVAECVPAQLDNDSRKALELRSIRTDNAGWLPELVAAFGAQQPTSQLTGLSLLLLAPLPLQHQPLLLQLTGLEGLALARTPPGLCGCASVPPPPALLPAVLGQLSALGRLKALTACVAAAGNGTTDGQVAVMLQELFASPWGAQLTQLSFGTAARATQLCLSAPLRGMAALADLTCQPGFTLDAEDVADEDAAVLAAAAAAGPGSAAAAAAGEAQPPLAQRLVPSLTRLVLDEGDPAELLALLAAHPAAATQLRQLELNTRGRGLPCSSLVRLSGLEQLKATVWEQDELFDFHASGACRQLHGLSLAFADISWLLCGFTVMQAVLQPMTALTALTVQGVAGAGDCLALVDACQQLHQLQQLLVSGYLPDGPFARAAPRIRLCLPSRLQELSVDIRQEEEAEGVRSRYLLEQPAHAWPDGLTRLELLGMASVACVEPHSCSVAACGADGSAQLAAGLSSVALHERHSRPLLPLQLQQLDLWTCALEDWQQITKPGLTQLQHLGLRVVLGRVGAGCCTPAQLQDIAAALQTTCPRLQTLKLAWTGASCWGGPQPSDEVLLRLAPSLANLTGLERLRLEGPHISSDAVAVFRHLGTLTRLQELCCDILLATFTQPLGLGVGLVRTADVFASFSLTKDCDPGDGLSGCSSDLFHHVSRFLGSQPGVRQRAAAVSSVASSLRRCVRLRRLALHPSTAQDALAELQQQLRNCIVAVSHAGRVTTTVSGVACEAPAVLLQLSLVAHKTDESG